jgi:hypothetical protein
MRAVEKRFKELEQEQWRKSDPAAIERTNGMLSQLEESISLIEKELVAATASKDSKKITELTKALEARSSWLAVVKQNAN